MSHRARPLNMAHVRAFVEVADVGSITRAAPRLGYSQPGLSQRLQAFERGIGARLFDRGHRGVELTPEGLVALAHARELLAVTDRMHQQISQCRAARPQPPSPPERGPKRPRRAEGLGRIRVDRQV
jgi:DNA-binding transcriptional LysR family regulator